jgi:hypothetical protein
VQSAEQPAVPPVASADALQKRAGVRIEIDPATLGIVQDDPIYRQYEAVAPQVICVFVRQHPLLGNRCDASDPQCVGEFGRVDLGGIDSTAHRRLLAVRKMSIVQTVLVFERPFSTTKPHLAAGRPNQH